MSYDYWDISSGEGLDEDTLHERYDDLLDEVTGEVKIGELTYQASRVLKEVDPIAYRVGYSDWLDGELGETITEDDPHECEGHESLAGEHMGETVYCDGSCTEGR